jgi:DNA-binding PadR family transcriptional regulator
MNDGDQRVEITGAARTPSPLAWAVLGLLIEEAGNGYELAQRFSRVYGDTLALSHRTKVYRLIDTLHANQLIEETPPSPDEPPARNRLPKPHYRVTERGVRAYAEWLLTQIEEERQRQRLFARQLAMLEPQAALEVINLYERECLAEADEASPPQSEREVVAERLSAQQEELSLGARLSWIRYARRELEPLIQQRGGAGGQR